MRRRSGGRIAVGVAVAAIGVLGAVGIGAAPLHGQDGPPRRIWAVEATPLGALPPLALPMPASRNHNYSVFRLQGAMRTGRDGDTDLLATGVGVDIQWRGGSVFGLTAGYQQRDCPPGFSACDGHPFFGARGRVNVVTAGPTIAESFGDYSATTTLGAELGFGYAPGAAPNYDACTLDVGMPLSLAMLQTVRVVAFVMPTGSIDLNCGSGFDGHRDLILNAGVGIQQLFLRGLDVYLGGQRVIRDGAGYQFGLSIMYVHLP